MENRTEEDWFLRGGERPDAANAHGDPGAHGWDSAEEGGPGGICQNCGSENPAGNERCACCGASLTGGCPTGEYCGDDGDGVLQDWTVTMSRTRSVQQTAEIRVKAHSEDEAMDLVEGRAEDEADDWPWEDNDDTEEFEDVEAIEAEVAR